MRTTLASILLCLLTAATPTSAARGADKPSLIGHWEGSIKVPAMELKIKLDFSAKPAGGLTGDISIPSQGLKDAPLIDVSCDDSGKAKFEIENIPGKPTFEGKVSADSTKLEGDFHQAGLTFPFALEKGDKSAGDAKKALHGFDAFVETALKSWKVPGLGLAIVRDGEILLVKGYGYRDVAGKIPVTGKTAFAIGSCTKAFTTFVIATLIAEGKLDWDKPVREFLPGFRMKDSVATDQLTPRDLVTHRSGLPRHDLMWYNSSFTRKEMVDRLRYLEPSEPFRAKWQYNNLMFLTSGYLIEQLSGQTWEDAVRYRVFEPLGMKSSVFRIADVKKLDDYALPYDERDDVVKPIPFREISNVGPAGSIHSTPEDMAKWVLMLLNRGKGPSKPLVGPAAVAELFMPQMVMGAFHQARGFGPKLRIGLDGGYISRAQAGAPRRKYRWIQRRDGALSGWGVGDCRVREHGQDPPARSDRPARGGSPAQAFADRLERRGLGQARPRQEG